MLSEFLYDLTYVYHTPPISNNLYLCVPTLFLNIGEEQLIVKKEVCLRIVSELQGFVCHHPNLLLASSCTSGLICGYAL